MTFFSYYHKQSFYDALDTIEKLNLIPLDASRVDSKVNEFKDLSIQVQRIIPDILLACMNILYAQFKEAKSSSVPSVPKFGLSPDNSRDTRLNVIRSKAKAIISYAGMIPYRMPRETNAKLVHLEVIMN
jgi:nuclear pore complex protein Nup93